MFDAGWARLKRQVAKSYKQTVRHLGTEVKGASYRRSAGRSSGGSPRRGRGSVADMTEAQMMRHFLPKDQVGGVEVGAGMSVPPRPRSGFYQTGPNRFR